MISSTVKLIGCLFAACVVVAAQTPVKKTQMASVTGKITLKGKGIAGVLVAARGMNANGGKLSALTVATDQQGNYRMSNVLPGEYEVGPAAPNFVVAGHQHLKRLIIAEGENLEGIDFTLIPGGAITGKVTDAQGKPLIEERIQIIGPEEPNQQQMVRLNNLYHTTDDRGVYRVYGLAPGKYKIAAGIAEDQLQFGGSRRSLYTQTFYPSTNDQSKATIVEVSEGSEATNVDIILRRAQSAFTVSVRVVDGETGKPLPNVRIGLQKFRENGSSGTTGPISNALGEIKLEHVTPGKYAVYIDTSISPERNVYAEAVTFEVVDQDVTNLVIKTSTPGSVSGVVVLDGMDDNARRNLKGLMITAHVATDDQIGFSNSSHSHVNADGSFTLRGMPPGQVLFSVQAGIGRRPTELEIARIERDGVVQSRLDIKDREQITNLRLIVKSRTGGVRGLVKVENGQLPSTSWMQVHMLRVGDEGFGVALQLDDRGRFVSPGLAAGVYEVTVTIYTSRSRGRPLVTKQQVVVTDNQVSEVTVTVDLKAESGPGGP